MNLIRSCSRLAASAIGLALLLGGFATAAADTGGADRHPRHLLSPAKRPAGVPANYVLTHNGFFHPSCVITVASDEVVGADLVIRGMDGTQHARIAPCAYRRYSLGGRSLASGAEVHPPPTVQAPATYDGYIVFYSYYGSFTSGSTLVTDEVVPPPPTNVADQDIAFFNDILTSAGGGDILQPVLDFNGETRGKWSIESEHCCISGNDMQTTSIVVVPGDLIAGTVAGTGCDSTGVCQAWTVTTADVTSGKSTTLNTTAPTGVPNGVSPGSLETYGVSSCDMFPAGGETTFTNNALTDPAGHVQTLKYQLGTLDQVAAEVPTNCGYSGKTSGDDFTLIYGMVMSGADGGMSGGGAGGHGGGAGGQGGAAGEGGRGGGAGGGGRGGSAGGGGRAGAAGGGRGGSAGVGGRAGSAGGGGSGGGGANGGVAGDGFGGAAGRAGADGIAGIAGAAGSPGTGGAAGSAGSIGIGGSTGAGGRAVLDAGSTGIGGSNAGSSGSSGCSCSTGSGSDSAPALVFLPFALLVATKRRKRPSAVPGNDA